MDTMMETKQNGEPQPADITENLDIPSMPKKQAEVKSRVGDRQNSDTKQNPLTSGSSTLIIREIEDCNYEILHFQDLKIDAEETLRNTMECIVAIETQVAQDVLTATIEENGKTKSRYSNDKAREAAIAGQLENYGLYKEYKKTVSNARCEIANYEANIDFWKRRHNLGMEVLRNLPRENEVIVNMTQAAFDSYFGKINATKAA